MNRQKFSRLSGSAAWSAVLCLLSTAFLANGILAQSPQSAIAASSQNGTAIAPFLVAPSFSMAGTPTGVATFDLNQDGKLDLVTTDSVSGKVTVFLGAGNGKFASGLEFATGAHPGAVVVADLNGDGHPEVIVGDESKSTISVYSSDGNGELQLKQTLAAGIAPAYIAVGDFNGDGKADLVVASRSAGSLALLLNDGKGNLQKPALSALRKAPTSIATADLNNDGHADVAIANSDGTVSILLGTGSGSFRSLPDIAVASGPLSSIVAVDFDRDGNVDLAVTQLNGKTLSVLPGKGDGSFRAASGYTVGNTPVSALAADLDGDGVADLVVVNQGSNTYSVLGGNGDGTFKSSVDYVVGNGPVAAVAGAFNTEGHVDLAIINPASQTVSLPPGNGDGTFKAARSYLAGIEPRAVASADLNGDKLPDLVVTNYCGSDSSCAKGGSAAVFLGNADGSYKLSNTYPVGAGPVSVALADVNGDKLPDMVVLNRADKTVSVLLGKEDGSFEPSYTISLTDSPIAVVTGDFNKDGKTDLAVLGDCGASTCSKPGSVEILQGQGDGGFSNAHIYPTGYAPTSIAVGDLNQDKNLDLVVANRCGADASCKSAGTATVLLGGTAGKFTAAADVAVGNSPSSIALGDMSGRGVPDLLVANSSANTLAVLHGNGDGSFQAPAAYAVGNSPGSVVVADFNGDGKPDVAVANVLDSTVSVLYGKGDGTLNSSFALPVGTGPAALTAVAATGSTRASLATANGNVGAVPPGTDVSVLFNVRPEVATITPTIATALTTGTASAAYGTTLVFTSTVTGTGGATQPTGTVTFNDVSNADAALTCTGATDSTLTQNSTTNSTATCTISTLSIGSHQITSTYVPGTDPTYLAAGPSTPVVAETITKATPSVAVTLTTGASPAGYATALTFTATVTGVTGLSAPTGSVTFADGATTLPCTNPGTLTAGATSSTGTCNITSLAPGAHNINATYVPATTDANYLGATSGTALPQTIDKLTPTVAVTLTTGTTPSTFGAALTFTATVPGASGLALPTGAIAFFDGATALTCSNTVTLTAGTTSSTATCNNSTLAPGPHSITADYTAAGTDQNYNSANSAPFSQPVNKPGPAVTVALTTGATPSNYGTALTFTATVPGTSGLAAPTGTVSFLDGATALTCSNTVTLTPGTTSSTATCNISSLVPGTHSIIASYTPAVSDTNYSGASSSGLSQVVNKVTPIASVTLTGGANPSSFGTAVTFTATVSGTTGLPAPTGTVSFLDGASALTCSNTVTLTAGTTSSTALCNISSLSPGSHSITATYTPAGADTNYNAATSTPALSQTVNKSGVTFTLASSEPVSSNVNDKLNFTATVSSTATPAPSGSVSFTLNGAAIATCQMVTITAGTAVCPNINTLVAPSDSIGASYSGDTNYSPATATSLTQTVKPLTSTLGLTPSAAPYAVGTPVTLNVAITGIPLTPIAPSGKVNVTVNGVAPASCTGLTISSGTASCQTQFPIAQSYVVQAVYTGTDNNFTLASSTSQTLQVGKATNTQISLISGKNPSSVNQSVGFVLTVAPPTGTISPVTPTGTANFMQGATPLCTGVNLAAGSATCNFTFLAPSSGETVSALYNGDANYSSGSSNNVNQIVNASTTTTALTGSPTPSVVNQAVLFTASVTPTFSGTVAPAGTVTFNDAFTGGTTALCTAVPLVAGTATCPFTYLGAGPNTVTATFNPTDGNFATSTSTGYSQTVNASATTVTIASSAPGGSTVNQGITFTSTVTAVSSGAALPQGSVTYTDTSNGTQLCKVNLTSTASVPPCPATLLTAGTHTIVASFTPSNTSFTAASSLSLNQNVIAGTTTLALVSSTNPSIVDQSVTFTATVTPTPAGTTVPTGKVTFSYLQNGTAVILCTSAQTLKANGTAACSVPLTVASSYIVSASYASGDSNFTGSSSPAVTQVVNQTGTSVTVSAPTPSPSFVDQQVSFTAVVAPVSVTDTGLTLPTGTVTFTDSVAGMLCTSTLAADGTVPACNASIGTAGVHNITASYSGDTNFTTSTSANAFSQTVNKATTTLSVVSSSPTSVVTQSVTYTATITPALPGTAPTGGVAFYLTQGSNSYSCPPNGALPANGPSPYTVTCTISFPSTVTGNVSVTASYSGDSNFTGSNSSAITQVIQNFSTSISPSHIILTQGALSTPNTNLTDPFNATPINLTSTPQNGFTDPILVTSCIVNNDASGNPIPGLTCATQQSPTSATGVAVVSATSDTPIGQYTVELTVTDIKVPTLFHLVDLTVNVINLAAQASTPVVGTATATFNIAAPLPSGSTLAYGSISIVNGDGTYTTIPITEVGIQISAITQASPTSYTFTITAGSTAQAKVSSSSNVVLAAAFGVPLLFAVSLLPGMRKRRKNWLSYLGVFLLAFAAMHGIGCSSGGFTRSSVSVGEVGSYVIQIQDTQTKATVAVVPLLIEQ